jgi:pimeloyl-ACP methyl ester carboxylesterase
MSFAKINDIDIYYEIIDFTKYWEKEKEPIILFHGLGVDHTVWIHMVPLLSRHYPTIVVECRGHGRSSKPVGPYEISTHADDMAALCDFLNVNALNIVGTSMGGLIAQQMAIRHPNVVHSLILINTFCETPGEINLEERLKVLAEVEDLESHYMEVVRRGLPEDADLKGIKDIVDLEIHNPREVLAACTKSTFSYTGCEALPDIKAPTLIIAGEKDSNISPNNSHKIHSLITHSKIHIFPNVGHAIYREEPNSLAKRILEFLSEYD